MSRRDQALFEEALRLFDQLRSLRVEPILVGALAVRAHVEPLDWPTEDEELGRIGPGDASLIGRAVQVTDDVDIAAANHEAAVAALRSLGYRRDPALPVRWVGALQVDLLPGAPDAESIHLPIAALQVVSLRPLGTTEIRVAAAGSLVVLKAYAHDQRQERRDLADAAALALTGRERRWPIRAELELTVAACPEARRWLERLRGRFLDPDAEGPAAFAAVVRARSGLRGSPAWAVDEEPAPWDGVEEEIRAAASDAMRLLLRDLDGA